MIIFNCGGLMRRKSDEIDYEPQVGLLYKSGRIEVKKLSIKKDKIRRTETRISAKEDMELSRFLTELGKLQKTCLDFRQAVSSYLNDNKLGEDIKTILLEAMEVGE